MATEIGGSSKPKDDSAAAIAAYQAVAAHWAHAEQVRWLVVYNYSMASTVLLLAWAAVFATNYSAGVKSVILIVLSAAGVLLTSLWLVLQLRANGFVHAYEIAGHNAEEALGVTGAFAAAKAHREDPKTRFAKLGTRYVAPAVLIIFAVVYVVLLSISIHAA
jgi:hypothetical protein